MGCQQPVEVPEALLGCDYCCLCVLVFVCFSLVSSWFLGCVGPASALRRPCVGFASALRRSCVGPASALRRPCVGPASALRRQCLGNASALPWPCVGSFVGPSSSAPRRRPCVGPASGLLWIFLRIGVTFSVCMSLSMPLAYGFVNSNSNFEFLGCIFGTVVALFVCWSRQ